MGLRAWLGLAVGVLALSGVMALLVALARTPLVRPFLPDSYFRVALVSHVDLFLVVWYLVVPVMIWAEAGLLGAGAERLSFAAVAGGAALLAVAGVAGVGEPVLAHYVPYLEHPLFLAGLALFLLGVGVAAAAAGVGGGGSSRPAALAARAAALCVFGSLLAILAVGVRLAAAGVAGRAILVTAFWAGGHLLQFAHVAGMVAAWTALLSWAGAGGGWAMRLLGMVGYTWAAGVLVGLGAAAALGPAALGGVFFTSLKAWGVGVPVGLAALLAAALGWRCRRAAEPGVGAAGVGLLVLAVGGVIALTADLSVQTTLIPGHYHAELTAVGLAYIGFTMSAVAAAGVRVEWRRLARWQPYLYGLGTLILVGGMAWAGVHGAPRKVAGTGFARDSATLWALATWGVGALMAEVGGLLYVAWSLATVWRWRAESSGDPAVASAGGRVGRGSRPVGGAVEGA